MTDRAALVTGASSGIGYSIADVLGAEGYAVTMTSRRPENLYPAAESLRSKGYRIREVLADVLVEEDISGAVAEHEAAWGRLDVLVNSAGGGIMGLIGQLTDAQVEKQLNLNLRSTITFVQRCLPLLQKSATGDSPALVVNVSSYAGKDDSGVAGLSVYAAAKHGVVGFTASLNAELAAAGIRATVLCPSVVDTPLTDHPAYRERMSTQEMIKATDLSECVRFLVRLSPSCVVPEVIFRNASTINTRKR